MDINLSYNLEKRQRTVNGKTWPGIPATSVEMLIPYITVLKKGFLRWKERK